MSGASAQDERGRRQWASLQAPAIDESSSIARLHHRRAAYLLPAADDPSGVVRCECLSLDLGPLSVFRLRANDIEQVRAVVATRDDKADSGWGAATVRKSYMDALLRPHASSCTRHRAVAIAIAIVLRTGQCREAVLIYHPTRRSALCAWSKYWSGAKTGTDRGYGTGGMRFRG
ncbi:hypothetical protein BJ912DRAFT_1064979 [Pholiota molesta]|nr:hypothetical protein BJ912DRAFT_1064979 [Pholiota molesta]